jgi:hypothetical protein
LARAAQPLAEPRRSTAALPPTGGQLHLHFHGMTAEDVPAIIERATIEPERQTGRAQE